MGKMTVYHGSYTAVKKPEILKGRNTKDFGPGFYCTVIREQAERWARRYDSSIVNTYTVRLNTDLDILEFKEMNEEWLDFVFVNRNGSYNGELYDIVFGPVANDTIYRTFIAYEEGILTKDETIARLKVKKLFDQMTFTTELALKELKYIGQFDAGRDQNE